MTIYQCQDCGSRFGTPAREWMPNPLDPRDLEKTIPVCPECESTEIERVDPYDYDEYYN